MAGVTEGDRVRVHYVGRLPDGKVFDSSEGADPIEFAAGSSEVLPGISEGVIGMSPGDQRTLTVPPDKAFGDRAEELVRRVARDQLPDEVQVGDHLTAHVTPEQSLDVWVAELSAEEAVLDANHPLAGITVEYELTLEAIV
jgi:peptidylprolyl isomerase